MPFFKPANKNRYCDFLQVSLSAQKTLFKQNRKRAYLFTLSGTISIEAAICMCTFIIIVLFVVNYMLCIHTEFSMQVKINNIVRESSKNMYYARVIENITEDNDALDEIKSKADMYMTSINKGYLKARLYQETLEGSRYLLCGIAGINMSESIVEDNIVDLVASYKMKMPLVNKYMTITQRCKMRGWNGEDISAPKEMVYITKNGTVYHTTKDCSHLSINIRKITYGECKNSNNVNNEKYTACELCVNGSIKEDANVFITEDGNRYHNSLKCSGITRNIICISKTEVKDMPACSRCGKEENDN